MQIGTVFRNRGNIILGKKYNYVNRKTAKTPFAVNTTVFTVFGPGDFFMWKLN